VLMPWLANVPAVVEAWYAGNGGGDATPIAVREVESIRKRAHHLSPRAKTSLPRPVLPGLDAHGAWFDVDYVEGAMSAIAGSRKDSCPLFPFASGSPTAAFRIDGAQASAADDRPFPRMSTNDGSVEGKETVEAYAVRRVPDEPARLIGLGKDRSRPGETHRVSITADRASWRNSRWTAIAGTSRKAITGSVWEPPRNRSGT